MKRAMLKWSDDASAQYHQLPPHLQQNALNLAGQLQDNPSIGERFNAHTLRSGKVIQVYAIYGLQLALDYTIEGWFRKRIVIVIEHIRPMDLLPTDEIEARRMH